MIFNNKELTELITDLNREYSIGNNVMEYARKLYPEVQNSGSELSRIACLIAYDLQAGSYVDYADDNLLFIDKWCDQLSNILKEYFPGINSLLEVGVGECTTLAGVSSRFDHYVNIFGFDQSLSRIEYGKNWLKKNNKCAHLFVGEIEEIPFRDSSIDLVYTSHSLEPNRGLETKLISELIRVANVGVVLIEPIYELASVESKKRMDQHYYVKNLLKICQAFDVFVEEYKLLPVFDNPLNRSGVIVLRKKISKKFNDENIWQCPVSKFQMNLRNGYMSVPKAGIIYPVINDTPMLLKQNAIISSYLANK